MSKAYKRKKLFLISKNIRKRNQKKRMAKNGKINKKRKKETIKNILIKLNFFNNIFISSKSI